VFDDDRGMLQGTLELLILKALSREALHGYGVANWIGAVSEDVLRVEEGSLYPALHRLERKGLIAARWGVSENNRKAKFYRLTRKGRRRLQQQTSGWDRFSEAVAKALHGTEVHDGTRRA